MIVIVVRVVKLIFVWLGDSVLVLVDGMIDGFVGGVCV